VIHGSSVTILVGNEQKPELAAEADPFTRARAHSGVECHLPAVEDSSLCGRGDNRLEQENGTKSDARAIPKSQFMQSLSDPLDHR
jgi:hypothetical protein